VATIPTSNIPCWFLAIASSDFAARATWSMPTLCILQEEFTRRCQATTAPTSLKKLHSKPILQSPDAPTNLCLVSSKQQRSSPKAALLRSHERVVEETEIIDAIRQSHLTRFFRRYARGRCAKGNALVSCCG
jgi:hypothetical protein